MDLRYQQRPWLPAGQVLNPPRHLGPRDRGCRRPAARSAVEHRPADVVPLALVVEDELPDRRRGVVTLPLTLACPCALALAFRRGSACGLDRIGGRTELVCGDMRNDPR